MRKLLSFVSVFLSIPVAASYFPPVLSPTGVTASTVAVVNGATTLSVTANAGTGNFNNYTTNLTTVTFNGTGQPVTQSGSWTDTVTQATGSNLRASVSIDGSSNTIQITGTPTVSISGTPTVTANAGTGNFNAYTTNLTTVTFNGTGQPVTQSGTWTTQIGNTQNTVPIQTISTYTIVTSTYAINVAGSFSATSLSTGAVNSAVPTVATLIGAQGVGGNTSAFRVDSSSNLYVNINAGTVAATQSGTWTTQLGNTQNTVPIQVISTNTVITGSISNTGFNVNNSPTVQIGNTQNTVPIQTISTYTIITSTYAINVAGSFSATSLSTGAVNSAVPTVATLVGAQGTTGNTSAFRVDSSSNLYVNVNAGTVAATQSGTWTMQVGNTQNTVAIQVVSTGTTISGTPTVSVTNTPSVTLQNGVMSDSSTYTLGTSSEIPHGGVYILNPTVLGSTVTAAARINRYRSQYVTLMDDNNVILGTSTANAMKVDASGATVAVSQSGTWTVQPGNTANTTAWKVDNSAVTQPTNLTQINGTTISQSNGTSGNGDARINVASDNTGIANWGQGATGSAVPAGATYSGGIAKTALPSAGSDGNMVGALRDKYGRDVTIPNCPRDLMISTAVTLSASTSETNLLAAGGSSVFDDMVAVLGLNTSATATRVDFRSKGTGNAVIDFALYLPAGDTRGATLPQIWPQLTSNTVWTVQSSASVTDVRIYAVFCQNK